uniref:Septin-type G domain-containing protein n=1 Tax=Neogobius melanostomus TaxID=47308 RepID=A0A8C6TP61_9GOBI
NDGRKELGKSVKLDDGPPARYQLRTKIINLDRLLDKDSKLRKFTFGKRDHKHPNKTVLLVGATGSGKSTLINALVNFVMGVKFKDKSETQTTAVSIYEVFGFEGKTVPYSLTIIDTPGYGDTRGIEYDDIITKKLQDLFCVPDEVDTIDVVGLNDLYLNSVTSLFGRDMEQNIVALMTHSDATEPTDALQALNEAKVKCARDKNNEPIYFCFNNCQKKKIKNLRAAQFAFKTSKDGMKYFTVFLEKSPPQSLQTTVEVMKERIRLKACIQNLEERVRTIELKQNTTNKNKEELSKYEEEMKKNQNFTINVEEVYRDKETIESAGFGLIIELPLVITVK